MKIQLNEDHFLESDANCVALYKILKSINPKTGERNRSALGYWPDFGHAAAGYLDYRVKTSVAEDIKALAAELKQAKEEVRLRCRLSRRGGLVSLGEPVQPELPTPPKIQIDPAALPDIG